MSDTKNNGKVNRREFIHRGVRVACVIGLGTLGGALIKKTVGGELVWQLDASKCVQCGRCATSCVLSPSAVKCIHAYDMCGYCDLCGGYFKPDTKNLNTAAENQLCPTGAIKRSYIEDPFFEYEIDDELCNGCGKCVKGCAAFGNGSLQLQVSHDFCSNCNQCSIARDCPADAYSRIESDKPYMFTGF